ncbi:hypothetical protein SLEP1_g38163 [Rubroshorea leprosula]|uniref:Uncharacterized protein n=1 Tax=Rubroshorea leprosula TaxID=152421 RepID=A0AAV5KXB9_9ROSI|nr:hypothetical protein SLEP1_g38163 [Rubroshorea leprosula]
MKLGAAIGFVGVLALKLDHPWNHLCFLFLNNVRIFLSNLKGCLYLILPIIGLLVTQHISRLQRKFLSLRSHQFPPTSAAWSGEVG